MNSCKSIILTLGVLALAATGHAQVMQKNTLTLDGAKKVIAAAMAEAKAKNAPGAVIAVVDDGGNLMALERIDGTFAAGAHVSMGKARTAVQFKRPTRFLEEIINKGRTAMAALPDFTPLIGDVPIEVDGKIVGGVGVSGAASAQQDEELAIAGANALKSSGTKTGGNPSASPPAEVIYIPAAKVNEAFAKGAVLVGKEERMMHASRNYMVHASRRDAPGKEGRLTACEHGNRRVTRLEKNGVVTVLADRYEGKRLNSPNDLVYRADGALYFTDPPFGLPNVQARMHFGIYERKHNATFGHANENHPGKNNLRRYA